ncbi:hypothetical protein [Janthinobacterium sp. Ant5-2-1]|nr:hypothetical protein [Janthinobacterium sp. Ant5-2-1]
MKLSIILYTLASARLPSFTSGELQQLVGTAEGKALPRQKSRKITPD